MLLIAKVTRLHLITRVTWLHLIATVTRLLTDPEREIRGVMQLIESTGSSPFLGSLQISPTLTPDRLTKEKGEAERERKRERERERNIIQITTSRPTFDRRKFQVNALVFAYLPWGANPELA